MIFPLSYCSDNYNKAKKISELYNFKLNKEADRPCLNLTDERLELLINNFKPIFVDFVSNKLTRRIASMSNQGLFKACKPVAGLEIVDATAGFGKDSALLAYAGAKVVMLERNPVVAALLADGLERLNKISFDDDEYKFNSLGSLQLRHVDAKDYLLTINSAPDLIYIDPMHPVRKKSALVKREMQVLQKLFGSDLDAEALISSAIAVAKFKVVVKWPQTLRPLVTPSYSINGKTVRFDVYLA